MAGASGVIIRIVKAKATVEAAQPHTVITTPLRVLLLLPVSMFSSVLLIFGPVRGTS